MVQVHYKDRLQVISWWSCIRHVPLDRDTEEDLGQAYTSHLAQECLRIPQEDLESMVMDR